MLFIAIQCSFRSKTFITKYEHLTVAACQVSHLHSIANIAGKRIALNVYRKPSIRDRLMRRIVGADTRSGTGVYCDIVAHVPKASLEREEPASLARMAALNPDAARGGDTSGADESSLETYIKSIRYIVYAYIHCLSTRASLGRSSGCSSSIASGKRAPSSIC